MYAKRQALRCTTCAETAYLGVFRVGITFLKSGGADYKKLYKDFDDNIKVLLYTKTAARANALTAKFMLILCEFYKTIS